MRDCTLTQGSVAAVDSWEAPLSQTTHMAHCPPGTMRPCPSCLRNNTKSGKIKWHQSSLYNNVNNTVCIWWQLTSVRDDCVKGEVTDAPLPADRGPCWLAWMVVLHSQRETVPWEVGADMLLTHQHTHAVADAGGTGWECENNTLFNLAHSSLRYFL